MATKKQVANQRRFAKMAKAKAGKSGGSSKKKMPAFLKKKLGR